jgi:hypothetical protein
MTLLLAIVSIFTSLTTYNPLRGSEPTMRNDPIIQMIGAEEQQANPGQMSRMGVGGGHCPRG